MVGRISAGSGVSGYSVLVVIIGFSIGSSGRNSSHGWH